MAAERVGGEGGGVRRGVVDGNADLFEVVLDLDAVGGFADLLNGREQKTDEDWGGGNDDEQFNQGETGLV
jgi:hypothetical protein